MVRPVKVAMPAAVVATLVPPSVAPWALVSDSVTCVAEPVTGLPPASCTATFTVKGAPEATLPVGEAVKASFVGAPTRTLKPTLVSVNRPLEPATRV